MDTAVARAAGRRIRSDITFENRGIPPSDVPEPPYSIEEMANDTAALIERLDIGPVPVVGFSLGALITQELALARPDLVTAAVVIGSLGRKDLVRRRLGDDAARALTAAQPVRSLSPVERALQLFGPRTLDDDQWMAAFLARNEQPQTVTPRHRRPTAREQPLRRPAGRAEQDAGAMPRAQF